jgi:hypothetical protein
MLSTTATGSARKSRGATSPRAFNTAATVTLAGLRLTLARRPDGHGVGAREWLHAPIP